VDHVSGLRISAGFDFQNDLKMAHDGEGIWDDLDGQFTAGLGVFCDIANNTSTDCGLHNALTWDRFDPEKDAATRWSVVYDVTDQSDTVRISWEHERHFADGNGVNTTGVAMDQTGDVRLHNTLNVEF
jgi:hypothetical protein